MNRMQILGIKVSVVWLTLCFSAHVMGQNASQGDALCRLLQEEMQREMNAWQATGMPPYFMSFRVEDQTNWTLESNFGAVSVQDMDCLRYFTPMVRLGDWQFDDRHADENSTYETEYTLLPMDDGPEATKQLIYLATTSAYKKAQIRLATVRTESSIRIRQTEQVADYTPAVPQHAVEPPWTHRFTSQDEAIWTKRLCALTDLGAHDPDLLLCRAALTVRESRKYYVASDGSCIVQNQPYATLILEVRTRADDGMMLPLMKTWSAFDASHLPREKELAAGMQDLMARVHRLREAPVADPYSGPALMSAETAGVFFHEIFGHRIEGHRLREQDDAQTFKHLLNQQILPEDVCITMQPRTSKFGNQDLNGYYLFDDEGVPSEQLTLVEHGVLRNFLMTRTPVPGVGDRSNGNARAAAGYDPVSRQSNLFIETRAGHTEAELRDMLREACKAQGLDYGYYFTYVNGGYTQTSRYATNAFNVNPVEVFRIYTDQRPDELVRGVDIIGTPLAMFSQVTALGGTPDVFVGQCGAESGGVPVSCISPMILLQRIETQKQVVPQQAPPVLSRPAPQPAAGKRRPTDMIWQALEDELQRTRDSLYLTPSTQPFFTRFNLMQGLLWRANSAFGSTLFQTAEPLQLSSVNVLLGDYDLNSNEQLVSSPASEVIPSPVLDRHYGAIRRQLWAKADAAYKNAIRQWQAKKTVLQQLVLPEEELAIPDMAPIDSISYIEKSQPLRINPDNAWIQQIKRVSGVLKSYPDLRLGQAGMEVFTGDTYTLSSEGVRVQQPIQQLVMSISASVNTDDGLTLTDNIVHYATTPDQLPPTEVMMEEAAGMANLLIGTSRAARITENYNGPVLIEGMAVGKCLATSLFSQQGQGLVSFRATLKQRAGAPANTIEDRLDHRVMPAHLSVTVTPFLTSYNGLPLWGAYRVDAEGVVPDSVYVLVDKGILRHLLSGRTPTARVKAATGHARPVYTPSGISTRILPGVVQCTSDAGLSADSLRQVFLQAIREEGYAYGYIVRSLPGYATEHIYRLDAASGREELIRSGEVSQTTFGDLRNILGVTAENAAYNMLWNGVHTSIICPKAILFGQISVSKTNSMRTKQGPSIPGPLAQ